jgi:hypothetical protein
VLDAGLLATDEASEGRAACPERQVFYRPCPMWCLAHKRSIRGELVKNREGIKAEIVRAAVLVIRARPNRGHGAGY